MKILIIADDNTGATDAAGMLTSTGAKALLLLDPALLDRHTVSTEFDVVVVSTRIRSVSPDEAYRLTRDTIERAVPLGFDIIQLKYCSTFDSTPEGNIGQSLDAAQEVLEFPVTIVCPALPVNGRTTYMGYHFVHRQLLSESPLAEHPLNPMTDASLVRWLSSQTKRKIGLIDLMTIHRGIHAIREARRHLEAGGFVYHVTDAVEQNDIDQTVQAYADVSFLSGGSGVSQALGNLYFSDRTALDYSRRIAGLKKQIVVIIGSRSPATHRQEKAADAAGFTHIKVHPLAILAGEADEQETAKRIADAYSDGASVMLSIEREGDAEVGHVKQEAARRGLSSVDAGTVLGTFLGKVSALLVEKNVIDRLLVAGGETSGSVCFECGFQALEVGLPLDPGVPYCFPIGREKPLLILKSGNFGADDLFIRAAGI